MSLENLGIVKIQCWCISVFVEKKNKHQQSGIVTLLCDKCGRHFDPYYHKPVIFLNFLC